jgi:L-lactate dehydrogenase complex protein LldF
VKINIPHLLLNLRHQLVERQDVTWVEKALFTVWSTVMRSPALYELSLAVAGLLQKPFARRGWITKLPPPFAGWTQSRDFKALATPSFRRRWRQTLQFEEGGTASSASAARSPCE